MKKLSRILMAAGCAALLGWGASNTMAQGRGNFDPAQFRQRMMDNLRESLEVKDDAEWTAIEPKISKVMDAQRDVMSTRAGGGFMGFGGRGRRGGGGGGAGGTGSDTNNAAPSDQQGGGRRRGGGFRPEPSAAAAALQAAIDAKAPSKEIKEKLAALRADIKEKDAALEKAQEDLRSVLSSRQEAVAVLNGLMK